MGFYGNITNTSNTTFVFDKIYPNRLSMDANVNNDGIFIGRYVLVEYQNTAAYPVIYIKGSKFYSSPNCEAVTQIKFLTGTRADNTDVDKDGYFDGVYENEIVQNYVNLKQNGNNITFDKIEYYKCTGGVGGFATFEKTTPANQSDYIKNFGIDEMHYSNEKSFKGYDSTVWTKTSVESAGRLITKYVQIADLNSVVPTFDIAADAPTMVPITPHFDADSTNVYYKLHMQTPFGFRVKENTKQSDQTTTHYETVYDKNGNITSQNKRENVKADIFYNKNALEYKPNDKTNRVETEPKGQDEIKLTIGKSTDYDTKYQHYTEGDVQGDIQELSIHLPSVGYMVSQGWDIIHGPNRDDAQTDNNSSLQGRLDSFKAMEKDAIPMKRNNDGTFVGSRINGNSNRTVGTNKILEENLSTSFDQDDAWIRTKINTTGLNNTNKLSGISIHHTWHKQADTTSTTNKNSDNVSSSKASDKIDLYTPIVDKAGHVVGKNTETVTLPYGFKTIATNGRGTSTAENASTTPSNSNIVAESTQDTLNINSGNKWIRMDTAVSSDTLTIAHDIHETSSTSDTTDWTKTEANTTIPVPVYSFDDAGHYESHHTESYKLPFGYGKITGDSGSTTATATYDSLAITADDAWIETTVSKDKVNITHTGPVTGTPVTVANVEPEFGETFTITDWQYDSKGHKYGSTTHTVKMPDGSYTPANTATTHTDIITSLGFTPRTGAITSTKANTDTLTLYNYSANSGNLDIKATDTINDGLKKVQNHINSLDMSSVSTTDFITEITQIDGQVAVKRAKAGTLELGTDSTEKTVLGTDSLNQAINKIEARIKAEEENRKNAIDTLYGNNGEKIAETFDTIKEIADFLEQEDNDKQSGVEKIISDINTNTYAISTEESRATSAETNLATNIATEEARAKGAEQTLTTNLNNEITRAKGAESTLTTNLSGEITRATNAENTLNTRITNLVGNTSVSTQIAAFGNTLGTAAKSDANDFAPAGYYDDRVLTSVYEAKIASLEATIAALEARISILEPQPELPVSE